MDVMLTVTVRAGWGELESLRERPSMLRRLIHFGHVIVAFCTRFRNMTP
jgi:hypothetical protein